jgi:hypothetical protein
MTKRVQIPGQARQIVRPDGSPAVPAATIALGVPNGGQVHWPFTMSLLMLQQWMAKRGVNLELIPQQGFFIEDNRNEIARRFLEGTADWLLMIDSDISFAPEIVEMLLIVAGRDKKIVAASVPLGPPLPSCALRATEQPGQWVYLEPEEIAPEGTEVHGIGMPVFLAHREVYEAIARAEGQSWFLRKPVPRLNDDRSRRAWLDPDGRPEDRQFVNQGEDLSFCMRASDAGYKIWACRLPGLRHHKTALPLSHDDTACPHCGHDETTVDAEAPAVAAQGA